MGDIELGDTEFHSYIYFFKCRGCSLEFALFSWKKDWLDKHKPSCPECGKSDLFFIRQATTDKSISSITYNKHWEE